MRIWSLIFSDQSFHLQSARIAANSKEFAISTMEAALGAALPARTICQFLGKSEIDGVKVISVIKRDGTEVCDDEVPA